MNLKDIDVDIFRGEINTFITVKHLPTKTVIAKCYSNSKSMKYCLTKLAKELKCKVEQSLKH